MFPLQGLFWGQADAGEVVRRFGEFVGGGDLVIGFVMFAIIVVVNFLVITKGAERVAEVAARFTSGCHARKTDGHRC
jgi:type III secretory pathway component EscV